MREKPVLGKSQPTYRNSSTVPKARGTKVESQMMMAAVFLWAVLFLTESIQTRAAHRCGTAKMARIQLWATSLTRRGKSKQLLDRISDMAIKMSSNKNKLLITNFKSQQRVAGSSLRIICRSSYRQLHRYFQNLKIDHHLRFMISCSQNRIPASHN